MSTRALGVLTVVVLLLMAGQPAGADDKLTTFELENGLKVMLRPVLGAQAVAVLLLFDIGESHDPVGKSGLAHFVEHCYCTCAAGDTPSRTFRAMSKGYPLGSNAQTGRDYTVIAFVTEPGRLEHEIRDAAKRMGDLRIVQADLDRERPRVLDELGNMFRAYPNLAAANQSREHVSPSAKGARKGGVPAQVETFTVEDVKTWHAKYYKPCNARLVIAGNLDVAAARALVETHFAAVPAGEAVPAPRPARVPQPGAIVRVASPRRTGQPDWVGVAYATPPSGDDDYAPFLVFLSRLFQATEQGKIPDGMRPECSVVEAGEAFHLTGPVKEGESPEEALARLRAYLVDAATKPPSMADRALARRRFGVLLGTMPVFDAMVKMNPYGLALGMARRDQMGLDGLALGKALLAVDEQAFGRMVASVLTDENSAAAIVLLTE